MVRGSFETLSDVVSLFPTSVADVKTRVAFALEEAKKDIAAILALEVRERTFANTARALDDAEARFDVNVNAFWAIKSMHPDKALRDICYELMLQLHEFSVDAFLHVDLYKAFKAYVDGSAKTETLTAEQKYFLQESMKSFHRAGLHLPPEQLAAVKKLQKELAHLGLQFSRNIATDDSSIHVPEQELDGTTPHFLASLERDDENKCIVKCDYPSVAEVMKHCSVGMTRCALSRVFNNRAYPANKAVLESVIAKRDELAKLLGFESYAELDLDNQMAKSPGVSEEFIRDLAKKVEAKEDAEFSRLTKELPAGITLVDNKFNPWDLGYVAQCYKKKHFNIDDREIAEYFTMEKTIDGIFAIYQKFLGLEFTLKKPAGLWHEDASVIEVHRKNGPLEGGTLLEGYIFLDLHPRQDKYTHACCGSILGPRESRPSVAVVIANFPKSTADRPSLLKHNDVITFFHEFGHAMHNLLGRTETNAFAGYNTKTDFVEVPSQMFEEWMWDKDMLKNISSHYKTGNPLSDELIEKMVELKTFDSGYRVQRQCFLSLISMTCFKPGGTTDLDELYRTLHTNMIKHVNLDPEGHRYASFGHLTGYGAKYYSYLWSEVYAHDLFDTIRNHGLLNEEIGQQLVSKVLSKGGSIEPAELLRDFLGREPNQEAFLHDIGI